MSTYGHVTVTGPTSRITRIVQSAEPADLAARANAAIGALPAGYIVVGLSLAGAGAGSTFSITIEAGLAADTVGGFQQGAPVITCYSGAQAQALEQARSGAGPGAGTFADTQVAGSSLGTVFMGMVVEGFVEEGIGPQGPQGPQGQQGVSGPQGPQGIEGPEGAPFEANISEPVDLTEGDYTFTNPVKKLWVGSGGDIWIQLSNDTGQLYENVPTGSEWGLADIVLIGDAAKGTTADLIVGLAEI